VQVNEILSINWDPHPRALGWRLNIGESELCPCGHWLKVCPCNAAHGKSCSACGISQALQRQVERMIDVVKASSRRRAMERFLKLSEAESTCGSWHFPPYETVCRIAAWDAALIVWTKIATFEG